MKTCKDCPAFRKNFEKVCTCSCGTKKIKVLDVCVMSGFERDSGRFYETVEDDEMCSRGYLLLACKKQIKQRRMEQVKAIQWESTAKVAAEANEKLHNHIDSLEEEIEMLRDYISTLNDVIDHLSYRS